MMCVQANLTQKVKGENKVKKGHIGNLTPLKEVLRNKNLSF